MNISKDPPVFFFCSLKLSMITPMNRFRVKKEPKIRRRNNLSEIPKMNVKRYEMIMTGSRDYRFKMLFSVCGHFHFDNSVPNRGTLGPCLSVQSHLPVVPFWTSLRDKEWWWMIDLSRLKCFLCLL